MESIKKDSIITIDNGKKYIYVHETTYENQKYIMMMGITDDEQNVMDKDIIIVTEVFDGDDLYVDILTDFDMIVRITKMIKEDMSK